MLIWIFSRHHVFEEIYRGYIKFLLTEMCLTFQSFEYPNHGCPSIPSVQNDHFRVHFGKNAVANELSKDINFPKNVSTLAKKMSGVTRFRDVLT